jgi:hypothetical protein
MQRGLSIAMISLAFAAAATHAQACAPGRLVRMEVVDVPVAGETAGVAALPRVIHRFSNRRMRMEQVGDSADGSRMMLVIDAPRLWHVDLARHVGERALDPDGPESVVNAPLFNVDGLPGALREVEFGCEREFVARPDVVHESGGAAAATRHTLKARAWTLTVVTRAADGLPESATLARDGRDVAALRYIAYSFLDEVPEGLFEPPAGIDFSIAE